MFEMSASNSDAKQWQDSLYIHMSASNTTNWLDYSMFEFSASNSSTVQSWTDFSMFEMSASNSTTIFITFTNPYPGDTDVGIPLQPTNYVSVNHAEGKKINITWFYSTSKNDINTSLGNNYNITNSTINQLFYPATNRSNKYYWRVCANDGSIWENVTYEFKTEGYPGGSAPQEDNSVVFIFAIFALLIAFIALIKRRRK